MSPVEWVLATVGGLILRIGIPVMITVLVIHFLRQLDENWKHQTETKKAEALQTKPKNVGCWELNGCSAEKKSICPAYAQPEKPCWQVFRSTNGQLREGCIGCQVFKQALAPVPV
jgi:hypothetical protein